MARTSSMTASHWTDGAWPVVGIWVFFAAIIFAIWWARTHIMVRDLWILICASLAGTGTLVPLYGGFIYFRARRKMLKEAARGALYSSIVIFVLAIGASAYFVWLFSDAAKALR
jgi:hypothetical protein